MCLYVVCGDLLCFCVFDQFLSSVFRPFGLYFVIFSSVLLVFSSFLSRVYTMVQLLALLCSGIVSTHFFLFLFYADDNLILASAISLMNILTNIISDDTLSFYYLCYLLVKFLPLITGKVKTQD